MKPDASFRRGQTDRLRPLARYLHKQVGRPWDDVYAEISRVVRPDGVIQRHLHQHLLDDLVERHVRLIDGKPYVLGGAAWVPLVDRGRFGRVWVCPRTGLLRLVPRSPRARPDPRARVGGPLLQYHRLTGGWFEVRLTEVERQRFARPASLRDALLRLPVWSSWSEREACYGRGGVYAIALRQIARRELRRVEALPALVRRGGLAR
jgi:hypothetical protein